MQVANFKFAIPSMLAAMMLALVSAELRAQSVAGEAPTSQPTPAEPVQPVVRASRSLWSGTVTAFATAVVDSSDTVTLNELVTDDAVIRQFNRRGRHDLSQLREQASGMNVIMSRAYSQTPTTLVGDIAAAVREASLPDEIKRRLTPVDDAALKRANVTAGKWISASLFTSGSEPIALIMLCKETSVDPPIVVNGDEPQPRPIVMMPIFVLLKGEFIGDRMLITQICFGDPLPFDAPVAAENAASTGD